MSNFNTSVYRYSGRRPDVEKNVATDSTIPMLQGRPQPFSFNSYGHYRLAVEESIRDNVENKRLSKSQQIQHEYRRLSAIAFTSLVIGTWEMLLTATTSSLRNGGIAGMFWSTIWSYIGQFFLVLSLAEMSSMVPLSGGLYHWVNEFSPSPHKHLLSHCCGWLSYVGWQARFSVQCYIVASIVEALLAINDSQYTYRNWHHDLLTVAAALAISAFNIFAAGHLSVLEGFFAVTHVFALVPIVVSIWVLNVAPRAPELLTEFTHNGGGWPSMMLSVLVGQTDSFFVLMGSDSVAHVSRNIEDAGLIVPQCMLRSFLANLILAMTALATFISNIDLLGPALNGSFPPLVYIFQQAFDSQEVTSGFTIVVLICKWLQSSNSVTSSPAPLTLCFDASSDHNDRGQHYGVYIKAFVHVQLIVESRDCPSIFPHWLNKIQPVLHVPLNAIVTTVLLTSLTSLAMVPSTETLQTMISLSSLALHGTYIIALGCIIRKRFFHRPLPSAKWSLGRYGFTINACALSYAAWAFFWSCWPDHYEVTASNFNWGPVLFIIVLGVAVGLHAFSARGANSL